MIFKTLEINESNELANYQFVGSTERRLSKLGKLNIFVGTNNSGKSRFLRGICKLGEYEFTSASFDFDNAFRIFSKCINKANLAFTRNGISASGHLKITEIPVIPKRNFFKINDNYLNSALAFLSKINPGITSGATGSNTAQFNHQKCISDLFEVKEEYETQIKNLIEEYERVSTNEVIKIYIPTLRGLRPPKSTDFGDHYGDRTYLDYFFNKATDEGMISRESVFTGLSLYNNIRDNLLGSEEERTLIREFENYLSTEFFENDPVTLIPGKSDDVLTIKIGAEKEKKIFDLGDGIQSIIILNYAIFSFSKLNPKSTILVFVEEPELYLHPAFQRKLIERWNQYNVPNVQLFITTHSNHFLDLTIDFSNISIYSIKKELTGNVPKFFVENLSAPNVNLLKLLGVRNSSVFLSNSTIWVEGISDRIYIRKFIELYCKKEGIKLVEDLDYAFIEYGGGTLPHWSFDNTDNSNSNINTRAISNKIFLIADRDDTFEKPYSEKALRLKRLRENLDGKRLHVTQGREIENLITLETLFEVIKSRGDEVKGNLRLAQLNKSKKTAYLGDFIEKKLIKGEPKKRYRNKKGTGTVSDKPEFAELVCKQLTSYSQLSVEAKTLAKKIVNFIQEH